MTVNSDANLIAIVGKSHSGKSSIMRGLRCLFSLWAFFPRICTNKSGVGVDFDDQTVDRKASFRDVKGKLTKHNDRIIIDDMEPWRNFKRNMPEEVPELTGIKEIDIDGKSTLSLNFIDQSEGVLPEAYTPSQISKIFASISGRNKVDNAIKTTNTLIKDLRRQKESAKESHKTLEAELTDVADSIPDILDLARPMWKKIQRFMLLVEASRDREVTLQSLEKTKTTTNRINTLLEAQEIEEVAQKLQLFNQMAQLKYALKCIDLVKPPTISDFSAKIIDLEQKYKRYKQLWNIDLKHISAKHSVYIVLKVKAASKTEMEQSKKELSAVLSEHDLCPYSGVCMPENCKEKLCK